MSWVACPAKTKEVKVNEQERIIHTGFCIDDYNPETCSDCPCEEECLELYREEKRGRSGDRHIRDM